MRPERCWPLAVGVFRWTGMRVVVGVSVGRNCRTVVCGLGVTSGLAGGVPAAVRCPLRGPAGRRLIAQSEATSADRGRRAVMAGDGGRIGSLLLQGFTPVLGAPPAGVGRVYADHRDAAAGWPSRSAGCGTSRWGSRPRCGGVVSRAAAAQGFAAGGAGIGEVEVLHHHRRAAVLCSARSSRAVIAARTRPSRRDAAKPGGVDVDRDRVADRVARAVEHTAGEVIGIEIDTQHRPGAQLVERGRRGRGSCVQDASRYQRPRRVDS